MTSQRRSWALTAAVLALVAAVSVVMVRAGFRPQDGDHHVQLGHEVANWAAGDPSGVMTPEYLPWPNELGDLVVGFLSIPFGLAAADALLLSLMPVALCAALGAFWSRHGWSLSVGVALAAPFSIGATYGLGFYNYQVSIILAFATAAVLAPGPDSAWRPRGAARAGVLVVGLTLTWLAHILGFGVLVGYLLLNGGLGVAALRARLRVLWPVFVPLAWWLLAAPKGTVQAGSFDVVQRVVAIGSWDAFLTIFNNTERIFAVALMVTVCLFSLLRARATPQLRAQLERPGSVGLGVLALSIGVAGILVPPSLLNGAYLWHRAGMVATIFAIAWVGETFTGLGPLANKVLTAVGVAVFVGLSAARYRPVVRIAEQRDEVSALEAFIEPNDIVAAVSGPSGDSYTRAYPLEHLAGRMAANTDSQFVSNIFPASGESPMAYPDGTEFVWGRVPDEPFEAQPVVPTVFVAIGDLDEHTARRLADEGFHVVQRTPSGLAALWRR